MEYELQEAIRKAVAAADQIILAASDGSAEETNWLTGEVARAFVIKALLPFQTAQLKRSVEGMGGDTSAWEAGCVVCHDNGTTCSCGDGEHVPCQAGHFVVSCGTCQSLYSR